MGDDAYYKVKCYVDDVDKKPRAEKDLQLDELARQWAYTDQKRRLPRHNGKHKLSCSLGIIWITAHRREEAGC